MIFFFLLDSCPWPHTHTPRHTHTHTLNTQCASAIVCAWYLLVYLFLKTVAGRDCYYLHCRKENRGTEVLSCPRPHRQWQWLVGLEPRRTGWLHHLSYVPNHSAFLYVRTTGEILPQLQDCLRPFSLQFSLVSISDAIPR